MWRKSPPSSIAVAVEHVAQAAQNRSFTGPPSGREKGRLWIHTLPGPVRRAKNTPSPPKIIDLIEPARSRSKSTLGVMAATQPVSTCSTPWRGSRGSTVCRVAQCPNAMVRPALARSGTANHGHRCGGATSGVPENSRFSLPVSST